MDGGYPSITNLVVVIIDFSGKTSDRADLH
jgi:hypothetical protein